GEPAHRGQTLLVVAGIALSDSGLEALASASAVAGTSVPMEISNSILLGDSRLLRLSQRVLKKPFGLDQPRTDGDFAVQGIPKELAKEHVIRRAAPQVAPQRPIPPVAQKPRHCAVRAGLKEDRRVVAGIDALTQAGEQ